MKYHYLALVALTVSGSLAAEELNPHLSASAEFGVISASGNSESRSVNGKFSAVYDVEKWKYAGAIEGLNTAASADPDSVNSEVVSSAERYALDVQADRKLQNDHSLFVKANYDDDRFSGFDYETGFAVGYGHQVVKTENRQFRIQVGPGFRISAPDVGESQDEALISSSFNYQHKVSDSSAFAQVLDIDAGDERTKSQSITSLTSQIAGRLAMKLSLAIRHNSDPGFDVNSVQKGSVDRETSINLVYTLK